MIEVLAPRFNLQFENTPFKCHNSKCHKSTKIIRQYHYCVSLLSVFILRRFSLSFSVSAAEQKPAQKGADSFCPHIRSIRTAPSFMQPIGSVQSCPAADVPCKHITHSCLVLGIKLTVHGSREALREEPVALSSGLSTTVFEQELVRLIGEILRTISVEYKRAAAPRAQQKRNLNKLGQRETNK